MRDLRTAFFASGSLDLFAAISKVKTLQFEPSSYTQNSISIHRSLKRIQKQPYPFRTVMKRPDGIADIDSVTERDGEGATLGDGRCDGRLEEIQVVCCSPGT